MDRYIIDCSVAVKWFVPEELSETARGLLLQLDAGTTTLIAPDSFLAEFGHSLRTQVRRGIMTADAASAALNDMTTSPLSLVGTLPLAVRAFDLALAHMATF